MKRVGLFVGIDEYNNGITALNCAVRDARDLSFAFSRAQFDTVDSLLNAEAHSEAILDRVEKLVSDLKPDDLFVFYFSGHGREFRNTHYLVGPTGRAAADMFEIGSISISNLINVSNKPGVKRLFILDCCRSNILADRSGVYSGEEDKTRDISLSNALKQIPKNAEILTPLILNSCEPGKQAYEDNASGHGYFTRTLLNSIQCPDIYNFQQFKKSLKISGTPNPQKVTWSDISDDWDDIELFPHWNKQNASPAVAPQAVVPQTITSPAAVVPQGAVISNVPTEENTNKKKIQNQILMAVALIAVVGTAFYLVGKFTSAPGDNKTEVPRKIVEPQIADVKPAVTAPAVVKPEVKPVVTAPAVVKPEVEPVVTVPAVVKPKVKPVVTAPAVVKPEVKPVVTAPAVVKPVVKVKKDAEIVIYGAMDPKSQASLAKYPVQRYAGKTVYTVSYYEDQELKDAVAKIDKVPSLRRISKDKNEYTALKYLVWNVSGLPDAENYIKEITGGVLKGYFSKEMIDKIKRGLKEKNVSINEKDNAIFVTAPEYVFFCRIRLGYDHEYDEFQKAFGNTDLYTVVSKTRRRDAKVSGTFVEMTIKTSVNDANTIKDKIYKELLKIDDSFPKRYIKVTSNNNKL